MDALILLFHLLNNSLQINKIVRLCFLIKYRNESAIPLLCKTKAKMQYLLTCKVHKHILPFATVRCKLADPMGQFN